MAVQRSVSEGQPVSWARTPELKKEPVTITTMLEDRKARSKQSINRMAESP